MLLSAIDRPGQKDWFTTVTINSQNIRFKLDTGAQCNVMSLETYNQVAKQTLTKSKARLVAFGRHRLKSCGKLTLLCKHEDKYWPVEFEVLKDVTDVLGLKTCEEMKLVQLIETLSDDVLSRYADTCDGLGCITRVTHHIQLDTKHKPVVHPPRKVTVTIRSKFKKELQCMEKLEVIERVYEHTDWINSMVTVVKPIGKLRICICILTPTTSTKP